MALKVPTLDDRTYADLVREGMELIPRYAPEWTNHNAADPGITLVELFAYLTEIYLYRVDRVSEANKAKFLKLLLGRSAPRPQDESLDPRARAAWTERQLQQAVLGARRPFRVISGEDFEKLALDAPLDAAERTTVARAHCFARRNLEASTKEGRQRDRPGHVSLVFVPVLRERRDLHDRTLPDEPRITDAEVQSIRTRIRDHVEPRRLLTSRVHVVGPRYVDTGIRIRVALSPGFVPAVIEERLRLEVVRLFDASRGGPDHSGWPLGRSVYASDIYRRIGTIEGGSRLIAIDFDVQDRGRLRRNESGEVVGVQLEIGELFRVAGVACEFLPNRSV